LRSIQKGFFREKGSNSDRLREKASIKGIHQGREESFQDWGKRREKKEGQTKCLLTRKGGKRGLIMIPSNVGVRMGRTGGKEGAALREPQAPSTEDTMSTGKRPSLRGHALCPQKEKREKGLNSQQPQSTTATAAAKGGALKKGRGRSPPQARCYQRGGSHHQRKCIWLGVWWGGGVGCVLVGGGGCGGLFFKCCDRRNPSACGRFWDVSIKREKRRLNEKEGKGTPRFSNGSPALTMRIAVIEEVGGQDGKSARAARCFRSSRDGKTYKRERGGP